jgi:hypothetical protein
MFIHLFLTPTTSNNEFHLKQVYITTLILLSQEKIINSYFKCYKSTVKSKS